MAICSKCGAEILEGKRFCVKCGASVSSENIGTQQRESFSQSESVDNNIPLQQNKVQLPKVDIKLTKNQKNIALITGIVLILLLIFYNVGLSLTSREKVVARFNQALAAKDSSKLAKYIVSSDINQKIDAKGVDGVISYIEKNPSYENKIKTDIDNQLLQIESASKSKDNSEELLEQLNMDISNTNELFTLKKKGKTWVLYDKYVLEFKPVYINVQTDYKDTQIFLGDKLICTADKEEYEREVGPYIPGLYKMKALYKGKYVNVEKSKDVDLVTDSSMDGNQRIASVELNLDAYNVSVMSDFEDAKLFANTKDTGILVKDAKEFGPVSSDGKVTLYAQKKFPWGIVKSEEVKITGENSIELTITGKNEEVTKTLMETVNAYNKGWAEASTLSDVSKIVNASEKRKSDADITIQENIKNNNITILKIKKATFNLDSIRVYQEESKYYAEVYNNGLCDFVMYNKDATVQPIEEWPLDRKYILIYDEISKKWIVDDVIEEYFSATDNVKEFTF